MTENERVKAKLAKGLCARCNRKRGKSQQYCDYHLIANRLYHRKRQECIAWKPGGRGRPPLNINVAGLTPPRSSRIADYLESMCAKSSKWR
jgi:hypothetical protein